MTTSQLRPSDDTTILRVSGAQGIVAMVPPFLGFHPTNSLVLVCIHGPRQRVGPVVRLDLPHAASPAGMSALIEHAVRYADAVALVCYHEGHRPSCLDSLQTELGRRSIPVVEVISVHAGRIKDASTPELFRADAGIALLGPDDEQAADVASAYALHGRVPLSDRTALQYSIRPQPGHESATWPQAIANARSAATKSADAAATTPAGAIADAWRNARRVCAETGSVPEPLAIALVANIATAECRDYLVARVVAEHDALTIATLVAVAGQCPDVDAADLCVALACAAYRFGDGALAHCALDRVDIADPAHRLAGILRDLIQSGIHPTALDALAQIEEEPAAPVRQTADGATARLS